MADKRLFGWMKDMQDAAGPWSVFEWSSSSDDTALVSWAENFKPGYLDCSVDNTGPTPLFLWEQTMNGTATGQIELIAGRMIRLIPPVVLGRPVLVDYVDGLPAGMWESDEYGRPFNLNDLLA